MDRQHCIERLNEPLSYTAELPDGITAIFRYDISSGFRVEWHPCVPTIRNPRKRKRFVEAYRQERAAFIEMLATVIGGSVLVVDASGPDLTVEAMRCIQPAARQ